ncbi:probable pectate lyase 5 [Brachypodium distachyon]|uniref:Pectate lyase n=1 Tax=Brachypodium distachyon TaxID=15368 RepID=I1I4F1_BRADI|nr:probable pectate lyase 5 [Brachypodium distachyon]XP_024318286.1 probable pectate lyase 5 [Brachypodium distachyon]XP_024318287.1 probable pectate lyase 5 [Brachypodium distachyon]XP_024318288.1 probable pectate lyase 5 [Brachypodium distachyon]XP_024318289.1 probable pectate lyase 5 [Brachypodium distachyon]XP_024318290.1 probable pectate lyase 5 [Brachypodium distachyon]XP_024318291.1 probable pectate lyase 5 [Brachypodium distachyon]XP_024318292.1 probable pectate lyase 5 [Brachypodium|eukprot:XP_003571838.1 probable pectate lyase 5 [Brachypodium distachyon]
MAGAPKSTRIIFLLPLLLLGATASSHPLLNASLPEPAAVVADFHSKVATSRRRMQESGGGCMTGNPIDDCWRCAGTDWRQDRQRLADCGIGFGRNALGGKGGPLYVVTDSSDRDPVNPSPGTLRHAVIQEGPLWIVFAADMTIRLNEELLVNSYKTIDGRGANVHVGAGGACITLQYVSNVIIHNIHVHDCVPAGNANVRSSPTHSGWRTRSDGDGISLYSARDVWVDHCALSRCADGLVDAIMGSTAITVSNSYFSHHNEVMLLGHSDDYLPDSGMQVTIAFNHFGVQLVQRMPRCRRGYFHIVNNDYTAWEMYAIGGSASPTINSQGNRYIAPANPNAKEVTKRVDTAEGQWNGWNWRTEGDMMVNGAFFVPSGEGMEDIYQKASSIDPKSSALVDQLTIGAGVLGGPRDNGEAAAYAGVNYAGVSTGGGASGGRGNGYGVLGMVYANGGDWISCRSHLIPSLASLLVFALVCLHPL